MASRGSASNHLARPSRRCQAGTGLLDTCRSCAGTGHRLLDPAPTSVNQRQAPQSTHPLRKVGDNTLRSKEGLKTTKRVKWGHDNNSDSDEFCGASERKSRVLTNARSADGYRNVQFCYTQIAHVEQQVNGLLAEKRHFNVPPERITAILEAI